MKYLKKPFILLILCLLTFTVTQARRKRTSVPHIPILGWYSIPPGEHATLEHYREMREAGFDYSFSHIYKYEDAIQALDLCAKVGMKSVFMCPELKTDPEETVRRVMKHPGLGMYFLRDEPKTDEMQDLGDWGRRINAVDPKHPCYLNLLPGYGPEYEASLRAFSERIGLPQISFDHYPINIIDGVEALGPTWYLNLELVSAEARRSGVPLWAFALSTPTPKESKDHVRFPMPTIEQLRLQMYSDLAYGAQLLQYFTYWCPHSGFAPMTRNGHRTHLYELVRELNQEIQQRAFVWAGGQVERVSHLADTIPIGTHPLEQLPPHFLTVQNQKGSGLVSEISNGGRNFVMLLNTTYTREWHVCVETDDNVQLVRTDGTLAPACCYDQLHILSPGNCEIFEIKE